MNLVTVCDNDKVTCIQMRGEGWLVFATEYRTIREAKRPNVCPVASTTHQSRSAFASSAFGLKVFTQFTPHQ